MAHRVKVMGTRRLQVVSFGFPGGDLAILVIPGGVYISCVIVFVGV